MTRAGALARAGLVVSGAFFASRLLGYIRVSVTTSLFGAGSEVDAFFAAFRVPDLMFQLVAAGALGSALVPIVAGLRATGEAERGWRVGATVANLMVAALAVLGIGFFAAAPIVVPAFTPGFDPSTADLTIDMTRIMILSPILLALGTVAGSLLNASGRFTAAALAPVAYNAAIIAAALILGPSIGVRALAIGVVGGSALHLVVQVPALYRAAYRHRPTIELADPMARRVFVLMAPRALGLGAVQLIFLVNTTLASNLGAGAITAYSVAFTLLQLPIGLISQPLGVVMLPTMSRAAAAGARAELASMTRRTLGVLVYIMLIVTPVAIALREPLVSLLFGFGRFDALAVAATAGALGVFLVGLPGHGLIGVLARAFYADQDTRTPVVAAILAVVISTVVSIVTVGAFGIGGLALGISVGTWAEALFLLVRLAIVLPEISLRREVSAWLRMALLGVAGAVGAWLVFVALPASTGGGLAAKAGLAIEMGLGGLVGLVVYVGASLALRLPEPRVIGGLFAGALGLKRAA